MPHRRNTLGHRALEAARRLRTPFGAAVPGAAGWRLSNGHGPDLSAAEVDAMWRFRCGIFALKPRVDPAVDRAAFGDWVHSSQVVTRVFNERQGLEAMVVVRWANETADGVGFTLVLPEFIFLSVEARRRTLLPWMFVRAVLASLPAFRHGPTLLGGFGYPSGVCSLQRLLGDVRFEDEAETGPPGAPPGTVPAACWRRAFERLRETAGDRYDPVTRRKDMPTLPRTLSEAWAAAHADDPVFQRYLARNPVWREGYGLGVFTALSLPELSRRIARTMARRALRK